MKRSHCYFVKLVLVLNAILVTTSTIFILSLVVRTRVNTSDQMLKDTYSEITDLLLDPGNNTNVLLSILERIVTEENKVGDYYSQSIINNLESAITLIQKSALHKGKRAMEKILMKPIINNHNFSYIHNPTNACTANNVDVIVALPSATTNFEKRRVVRVNFFRDSANHELTKVKIMFFLGKPSTHGENTTVQDRIETEVKIFGDIVQEDFEDVYNNNRLKSVSILRWVSAFCSSAKYMIRSDDDIASNVSTLIPVLESAAAKIDHFIIGSKYVNDPPAREIESKYYLSLEEYPLAVLPPYHRGGLLGFTVSTVRILYEVALRIKPIWLEDVFITGLCASKAHIPIITHTDFTFTHVQPP